MYPPLLESDGAEGRVRLRMLGGTKVEDAAGKRLRGASARMATQSVGYNFPPFPVFLVVKSNGAGCGKE